MNVAIDRQYAGNLGKKIRNTRESKEIGLRELAKSAGLSASYLSEIETGISVPGIDKLQKLAKALKVSISSLIPQA
jgi:transcriptional regulator with XRE-family HTH domain